MRLSWVVFLLGAALGARAWGAAGGDLKVHFPPDGYHSSTASLWLVFSAPVAPEVKVDGRLLRIGRPPVKDVFHLRVDGLRTEGSRVEVTARGKTTRFSLFGPGAAEDTFHPSPPTFCSGCHPAGEKNCGGCHRWKAPVHGVPAAGGCARCHQPKGPLLDAPPALCLTCHREYAGGKHPRLRHPLSAARDPLRPARGFTCVSCHEPHVAAGLSRQRPEERREWCKSCHRR